MSNVRLTRATAGWTEKEKKKKKKKKRAPT
jgi:hypothetical protein